MIQGGCQCGDVRYEADNASHETNCHCTDCRRSSGAPFVAWLTVPTAAFRLVRGDPARYRSSASVTRRFCARCGTMLTFTDERVPDEVDIAICSLDEPERYPPKSHTYVRSRLPWISLNDGLPQYAETRLEGR
ncbi:MAG TPA: GFA family protein [Noviherbaspirillum sp.]|jgi:hypothetical protein|uniref:GFA family protein n=1 Tax=Noviherbaspirillum sp. TaxID=1926288 RepID=UPI002F95C79F